MKERIETGIPGVDEMIGGGIPFNSVVIVSGSPGIGKSNFAMQFLVNGAQKYDENGVYLTVEDTPENIREYGRAFGWDIEGLEKDNKIAIIAMPIYAEDDKKKVSKGGESLGDAIKRVNAKRVVLDSVTLFKYLYDDEIARRVNLLNFIKEVKDAGCTTLLVAEQHESSDAITYLDEHFLADALLLLFWSKHKDKHERCFRVVKMRGTKINPDVRPMEIGEAGITVFPNQVPLSLSE